MSELLVAWEYLTGYSVATHVSGRSRAEWPPHPARVFMALAAAWFETEPPSDADNEQEHYLAEGRALRWLETLGDPELSTGKDTGERSDVEMYVPVNDKLDLSPMTMQSAPALTRDRKARTIPRSWVGNAPCYLRWECEASEQRTHLEALDRLCSKVTRIGHSSSLVRMWVSNSIENEDALERFVPTTSLSDWHARTASSGFLNVLIERYGEGPRRKRDELTEAIAQLKLERKNTKGKGAKETKAAIDTQVAELQFELEGVVVRDAVRPTAGRWVGYRRRDEKPDANVAHTGFDTDILVLVATNDSPRLSAASTLLATQTLRRGIIKHCPEPEPEWVSGHAENGQPLQVPCGHMACIPLPFVGHQHADGHLLGVGIVFPRSVSRKERGEVLRPLLVDERGKPISVELTLGRLGVWRLEKRDWSESRTALRPERWTTSPNGTRIWASVTPVVLDRFPKADRIKDRAAWTSEVIDIITQGCRNIGLPEHVHVTVDIDTTSWHRGSLRAFMKRRPLRGQSSSTVAEASLGDGFPFYPSKQNNSPRPQVHVWLEFSEPVLGPVLIGAGRYLGYGLCLPWKEER
ncbi:MAG: type I-U CRISPR-associated protein Csb2 [Pirellulaceae bacterium]|nr:type I-U CRISPR-associated protein Cas5/Cas6 [Planctomycetales bacterium]